MQFYGYMYFGEKAGWNRGTPDLQKPSAGRQRDAFKLIKPGFRQQIASLFVTYQVAIQINPGASCGASDRQYGSLTALPGGAQRRLDGCVDEFSTCGYYINFTATSDGGF